MGNHKWLQRPVRLVGMDRTLNWLSVYLIHRRPVFKGFQILVYLIHTSLEISFYPLHTSLKISVYLVHTSLEIQ